MVVLAWCSPNGKTAFALHDYIVFNGSLDTEVQSFHANKYGYFETVKYLCMISDPIDVKVWSEKGKGKVLRTLKAVPLVETSQLYLL